MTIDLRLFAKTFTALVVAAIVTAEPAAAAQLAGLDQSTELIRMLRDWVLYTFLPLGLGIVGGWAALELAGFEAKTGIMRFIRVIFAAALGAGVYLAINYFLA